MANAKYSNGRLFRILTGSPGRFDKQYSVGAAGRHRLRYRCKGGCTQAITTKAAATLRRVAAAVFPQQKSHRPVLADPCVFPHLSSSSDLRILSSTQPSQVFPMTDFRQVWRLHAYSGGTVRDSHPVFYSLAVLLPHPQALKRNIYLCRYYTRPNCRSQYPKQAS